MYHELSSFSKERAAIPLQLIVFTGPPLTGKTTIARYMKETLNIEFVDVDEVRAQIYPDYTITHRAAEEIEAQRMVHAYMEMYSRARKLLQEGKSVIVVATHSRRRYHHLFQHLAAEFGLQPRVFRFEIPDEEVNKRLTKRAASSGDNSNIRTYADYESVKKRFEPYEGTVTQIDTTKEDAISEVARVLTTVDQ